jgi:hypothetical protein
MNTSFTNGRHSYNGKYNSRSQRGISKITKGMKINSKKLFDAFKKIENEKRGTSGKA